MQLYLRVCAPRTKRCSYLRAARAVALVREAWVQLRPLPGYQICAPGTARRVSKKGQGGHGLRNCAGSANDLEMQAWERGSCDRVRRCGQRLAARRPSARILQSGRQCGRGPRACARTEAAAGVLCGRTRHSLRENTQTGRAAVRAAGGRARPGPIRTRAPCAHAARAVQYPSCRGSPTRTLNPTWPWRVGFCFCCGAAAAGAARRAQARSTSPHAM